MPTLDIPRIPITGGMPGNGRTRGGPGGLDVLVAENASIWTLPPQ